MNKKNLLVTSAIISLSLLNVSDVQAEETDLLPQDEQTVETTHHFDEQPQSEDTEKSKDGTQEEFNRIFTELHSLLNDNQKLIIEEVHASENETSLLFKEAIVAHVANEFNQAIDQYDELLAVVSEDSTEENHEIVEVIELFKKLAQEEISLLDYDYPESDPVEESERPASTKDDETGSENSGEDNQIVDEVEETDPKQEARDTEKQTNIQNELYNFVDDLSLVLTEEQDEVLASMTSVKDDNISLFEEALLNHSSDNFEKASEIYETILQYLELNNSERKLVNLFNNLAKENTQLTDYDYEENIQRDNTEESTKSPQAKAAKTNPNNLNGNADVETDNNEQTDETKLPEISSLRNVDYRGYLVNSSDLIYSKPG